MGFVKAVKHEAKLRLALAGPAGAGKTYTALRLATDLADGKPIAVIDTERGSASKYADLFDFDVLELDTFHPQKYVDAIKEAAAGGYAVVVIDSLSHAWNGKGGILEIVQRNGNAFDAWAKVKPIEAALIESIVGAHLHIIATMRSKTEYVVEKDERGKNAPRKVGTAPVQRDGMEYEFDVFGELDQDNTLTIQKSRCPALSGAVIPKPGKPVADALRVWLSGAPAAPIPAADDTRKVVTSQISRDRARLQAEPIDETPITFTEEPSPTAETVGELVEISLVEQIKRLKDELELDGEPWKSLKRVYTGKNDALLAKLQELKDAKDDGYPLDRQAKKAQ